jgi:hypothetical protein
VKVTTSEYYEAFTGFGFAISGVVAALPFISLVLRDAVSSYAFPPLGGIEGLARVGVCAFSVFSTYLVFLLWNGLKPDVLGKRAGGLFIAGVAFFFCYIAAYHGFVRRIEIPAQRSAVTVSVGFSRAPEARRLFPPTISDEEMLRERGMTEEEIRGLWTGRSLLLARLSLLFSYLGCAVSLVGFFSIGALKHATEVKG